MVDSMPKSLVDSAVRSPEAAPPGSIWATMLAVAVVENHTLTATYNPGEADATKLMTVKGEALKWLDAKCSADISPQLEEHRQAWQVRLERKTPTATVGRTLLSWAPVRHSVWVHGGVGPERNSRDGICHEVLR